MQIIPLTPAGSNRVYTRIIHDDGTSHIHCEGTNRIENHAFITMARHFERLSLPTPRLLSASDDEMSYDQQDLGDTCLYDLIRQEKEHLESADGLSLRKDSPLYALLPQTMHALRLFHDQAPIGFDFSVCFPVPAMDRRSIFWDLNYFKYCFLKIGGGEIDEPALEDDFETLADTILSVPQDTLIIRDCQSRNVMIHHDKPYFIDFQGGRRGSRYYDIVSFLWQARANFSPALREDLLREYGDLDRTTIDHFILFRTLQVLGAYGFRGLIEHKEAFLGQIPTALHTLRTLFTQTPSHSSHNPSLRSQYPYLAQLFV